jgi:hypothetical protein
MKSLQSRRSCRLLWSGFLRAALRRRLRVFGLRFVDFQTTYSFDIHPIKKTARYAGREIRGIRGGLGDERVFALLLGRTRGFEGRFEAEGKRVSGGVHCLLTVTLGSIYCNTFFMCYNLGMAQIEETGRRLKDESKRRKRYTITLTIVEMDALRALADLERDSYGVTAGKLFLREYARRDAKRQSHLTV